MARTKALPLGRPYWRLQGAMLISALADACLFVAPIYWIFVEQGLDLTQPGGLQAAQREVLLLLTWVPLARLATQPLLAPLADRWPRGRVLSVALLLRAAPWVILAILYRQAPASARTLGALCVAAALAGLADTASLALVPRLVPPSEVDRALALSAGLPRAGFYLSVVFGLVVVALLGVRATLVTGAILLAVASIACGSFPEHAAADDDPRPWSPLGVVRAGPVPLALCLLAALTNLAVYPLYWIGPALSGGGSAADNLEIALAAGALGGLLALGVLSRLGPRAALGGTLLVLAAALCGLAGGVAPLGCGVAIGASFAAANLLLLARAIALAPDGTRARVAGLFGALFGLAGELGARLVQPALLDGGGGWLLVLLAAPIAASAIAIARSRRLAPAANAT